MKVLVVKTSSLGDIIHTLPALTDAQQSVPDIRFDWVVEESYAEIPSWHPSVDKVIPVNLRRWRRNPFQSLLNGEWGAFKERLRDQYYDWVIDAQGLLKSAFITANTRGLRCGLNRASAREPLATLAYQQQQHVAKRQHAITRVRQLFAGILGYPYRDSLPDYGIKREQFRVLGSNEPYVVFLHGTAWPTKRWPEAYWARLGQFANQGNYGVHLPWGTVEERALAIRIASNLSLTRVLPRCALKDIAANLAEAAGVVGVDTGLSHLAAALGVPTVTIYGPTSPELTGTWGNRQQHLKAEFSCAPCLERSCHYRGPVKTVRPACYSSLFPEQAWQALFPMMNAQHC